MKKILNIFLILLLFSGCDSTGIEQSSAEIHVKSSESEHSESFINLDDDIISFGALPNRVDPIGYMEEITDEDIQNKNQSS